MALLSDFATLAEAQAYSETNPKFIEERMVNERGVFALIGMQSGEKLMVAIETSPSIPDRVKAWFRPSEQGIDIIDPSALAILAGMVAAGVITQEESDALTGSAYETNYPFAHATECEFKRARGTMAYRPVTVSNGVAVITTNADCERHNPQIYQEVGNNYIRRAGFHSVEAAGEYAVACPSFPALYVEDAYGVIV